MSVESDEAPTIRCQTCLIRFPRPRRGGRMPDYCSPVCRRKGQSEARAMRRAGMHSPLVPPPEALAGHAKQEAIWAEQDDPGSLWNERHLDAENPQGWSGASLSMVPAKLADKQAKGWKKQLVELRKLAAQSGAEAALTEFDEWIERPDVLAMLQANPAMWTGRTSRRRL